MSKQVGQKTEDGLVVLKVSNQIGKVKSFCVGDENPVMRSSENIGSKIPVKSASKIDQLILEIQNKYSEHNGFFFSYEHPGFFQYTNGLNIVYCTPDFDAKIIMIDESDDGGASIKTECEVPFTDLTVELFFQSVEPYLCTEDQLCAKLAIAFSQNIREALSKDEVEKINTINAKNALNPELAGCCATGDFCDSNMLMDSAFTKVTGRDFNFEDEEQQQADLDLFNKAWTIAKQNKFYAT